MARLLLIAVAALVLAAGLVWFLWPVEPLARFEREMRDAVQRANERDHLSMTGLCSDRARATAKSMGAPLPAIALQVQKLDVREDATYEFVETVDFEPELRARARFRRKAGQPEKKTFEFVLPFLYEDGQWKLHDRYKDEKIKPGDLRFVR